MTFQSNYKIHMLVIGYCILLNFIKQITKFIYGNQFVVGISAMTNNSCSFESAGRNQNSQIPVPERLPYWSKI